MVNRDQKSNFNYVFNEILKSYFFLWSSFLDCIFLAYLEKGILFINNKRLSDILQMRIKKLKTYNN